jgi:hypothetical protein
MERIRKVNGCRGEVDRGRSSSDRTVNGWIDCRSPSIPVQHAGRKLCAAAAVGMTEIRLARGVEGGWLVSEWGTGLELMQEWNFGQRVRPTFTRGFERERLARVLHLEGQLQALRSDGCEPIALRSLEVPPRKHLILARQNPHGRRDLP